MKTIERSIIFMTAFVMLLLLNGKQVSAAEVLEPVEISSPVEVEENIKQDVGMFAQHDASDMGGYQHNSYYYKLNVEERGYLMIRALAELNLSYGTTNSIILWQNASMTANVKGYGFINRIANMHADNYGYYYLDPGTYYLEMQAGRAIQTCYAYFMPSSNVMSVSVNPMTGKADLNVTTTVPQASIQWVKDDAKTTEIKNEKFYTNRAAENTFEVKENGTYSVRVSSTDNDWKDFPVDVVVDVTGIKAPIEKMSKTVTVKKVSNTVTVKKGKSVKATSKYKVSDKTKVSKVTYKTSNKKVASVSKSGKIKGVKEGSAKITVTITFKDKSTKKLTFKVKVK